MKIIKVQVTPTGPQMIAMLVWCEDISGNRVVVHEAGVALTAVKQVLKEIADQENLSQYKTQRKDRLALKSSI